MNLYKNIIYKFVKALDKLGRKYHNIPYKPVDESQWAFFIPQKGEI